MTEKGSQLFEDFSRLMGEAADAAKGMRKEAETVFHSKLEGLIEEMELVKREEIDALEAKLAAVQKENESLSHRLAIVEGALKLAGMPKETENPS